MGLFIFLAQAPQRVPLDDPLVMMLLGILLTALGWALLRAVNANDTRHEAHEEANSRHESRIDEIEGVLIRAGMMRQKPPSDYKTVKPRDGAT